ncbi:MAG: ABC transporter substrate-binding protein [Pseudomonadota bacterium]
MTLFARSRLSPLACLFALLPAAALAQGLTVPPVEAPMLVDRVAAGELPAVADRLPAEPMVVDLESKGREAGQHGGRITTFVSRAKDIRYMAAWGYARLVGYDENYELAPDILEDVEVSADGTTYTFHLRDGHRWSDGHPFTTEDFRFWWEDAANNDEISPKGPPVELLVDGKPPVVTVIDETTIAYRWEKPNPRFLPALAQARPVYIYLPAHYMKMYHADFTSMEVLEPLMEKKKAQTWAALFNRYNNQYKFDNPKLPVLQPWVNTSKKNSQRYTLVRNPFYHRVDTNGRQLPYVDSVEMEIAASGLVAAKATRGEADLQSRGLSFSDAPVLKRGAADNGFDVSLWRSGAASEIAIYPNLNYNDEVWRGVMQDVRFRRALSLAISRKAINKVLYFGLAAERGVAALEESPFFSEQKANAWARFDLDEANKLLDEMGLTKRNGAGTRLLPDGRPMEIVIETAGERREEEDALQIVAATWARIGLRLLVKPLDRDILRTRAYAGRSMMVSWWGWNNGVPTADSAPDEVAPVMQASFCWPKWGQHYQTKGAAGEAPSLPKAQRLLELYETWSTAADKPTRAEAWSEMLAIHADEVYAIGTVSRAPVPIVSGDALRNVPVQGLYTWDPGAQLGVHRIDEFWFADTERREAAMDTELAEITIMEAIETGAGATQ